VWCLQIPLAGIPPLILAAKAILKNLTTTQLLPLSLDLIKGILTRNIKVVSYANNAAHSVKYTDLARVCKVDKSPM
jgi:hypothetical protein